jgi:hypothetical protein
MVFSYESSSTIVFDILAIARRKSNFEVKILKKQDKNLKTKDLVNIMPPN